MTKQNKVDKFKNKWSVLPRPYIPSQKHKTENFCLYTLSTLMAILMSVQ